MYLSRNYNSVKNIVKRKVHWHDNQRNFAYNHERKLGFIAIPKTGSTSIMSILRSLSDLGAPSVPVTGSHATALELRSAIGKKLWNDSHTFCVVRNPWSLMVSSYFWWIQIAGQDRKLEHIHDMIKSMGSFEAFIKSKYGSAHINEFKAKGYEKWFVGRRGNRIVTSILRCETLNEDWEKLKNEIDPGLPSLPRMNSTSHQDWRSYYSDETREIVRRRFSDEIEMFKYEF